MLCIRIDSRDNLVNHSKFKKKPIQYIPHWDIFGQNNSDKKMYNIYNTLLVQSKSVEFCENVCLKSVCPFTPNFYTGKTY